MNRAQIQEIGKLSDSIGKGILAIERKRIKLNTILRTCDHFFANNRSALKRVAEHDGNACGGYKDCVVCAGEKAETFATICRICKKVVR